MNIQTSTVELNRIERNDQDQKVFFWDCPECGETLPDGDDELVSDGWVEWHRPHLTDEELQSLAEDRQETRQRFEELDAKREIEKSKREFEKSLAEQNAAPPNRRTQ